MASSHSIMYNALFCVGKPQLYRLGIHMAVSSVVGFIEGFQNAHVRDWKQTYLFCQRPFFLNLITGMSQTRLNSAAAVPPGSSDKALDSPMESAVG